MAKRRKTTKTPHSAIGVTPTQKPDKRRRIQFKFWLDDNKPVESEMGASLDHLKAGRKYAKFMREAIGLMLSLMIGDVLMLCALFPGIVESIQQEARSRLLGDNARLKAQNEALQSIIDQQEAHIAQLEAELDKRQPSASDEFLAMVRSAVRDEIRQREPVAVEIAAPPQPSAKPQHNNSKGLKPIGGGLKPLTANTGNGGAVGLKGLQGQHIAIAAPLPDDDEDDTGIEMEMKQSKGNGSANRRFVDALLSLQETQDEDE